MAHTAAIVIPAYKVEISGFEEISFRQVLRLFKKYPIYLAVPQGLELAAYDQIAEQEGQKIQYCFFDPGYFSSVEGYNRLLVSTDFYKKFHNYDYILIHQLDAFVFEDQLEHWMEKGFDYVGAPWLENFAESSGEDAFTGVGNGGLSLRKVKSALKVLNRFSYLKGPRYLFSLYFNSEQSITLFRFWELLKKLTIANNTHFLFNDYDKNEDVFWGRYANRNFSWFRVPSPREALQFSMEVQPKEMYKINDQQLPFGCHAWWKYDLDFWTPFIEARGHNLSALRAQVSG